MAEIARSVPDGGTIVEIGTWKGGTAQLFHDVTCGRGVHVCTVDMAPQKEALERLQGTGVEVLSARSEAASRQWAESDRKQIDLLFIDGSHLFHDVFVDFNSWASFLRPGATVVFHDYDPIERGGIVHLGVQIFVDTIRRMGIVRNVQHSYKLFSGSFKDPANSVVSGTTCCETFIAMAKEVNSLWESNYAGWTLVGDDRFALLLRCCLPLDRCGYTWPPRDVVDRERQKYLVSAHPLQMPLDFVAHTGVPCERIVSIDSLKASYLVDHVLREKYQTLLGLSANQREFVKWADAVFTFEHAFGDQIFPVHWRDIRLVSDAALLSQMISREQVKLTMLARILSTFVDWTP